jgi:hypothetical protein
VSLKRVQRTVEPSSKAVQAGGRKGNDHD